jgi:hypothetical protein
MELREDKKMDENKNIIPTEDVKVSGPEKDGKKDGDKNGSNVSKYLKSTRFKKGGIATVFTIFFIIIMILVNIVSSLLEARYPSTKDAIFASLSEERCIKISNETEVLYEWIKSKF